MISPTQVQSARARAAMNSALRNFFVGEGYLEVETPALVPAPGMEPHITAFEVPFVPETDVGTARPLYLHTSPEYAMKRLLSAGAGPIFQIAKVFRNGEISPTHNPEFTMLEFYRPQVDYRVIMADLEQAASVVDQAVRGNGFLQQLPFERLTVHQAVLQHTGIDLEACSEPETFKAAAEAAGIRTGDAASFDDIFFHVFLQKVEPHLGQARPTFLIDYPASMASLSRLKPQNPKVAERFELYASGQELANGFSELNDGPEQRRRLLEEQAWRKREGRPVYPLDEKFLEAVGKMPMAAGVAVGLDRLLMVALGLERIDQVLLFPARAFFE